MHGSPEAPEAAECAEQPSPADEQLASEAPLDVRRSADTSDAEGVKERDGLRSSKSDASKLLGSSAPSSQSCDIRVICAVQRGTRGIFDASVPP